ncbi:hypothetical protein MCAG_01342 [Micromonospora sp. ATCC 39149]|uniref:hypothetical protein n=1 Tax=Micromonospora sp. (strain ATCC 39149 / NRRL 15099 / SCC 1413) TaxID=219305 RepID=UPI0001A50D0D|nr:hypothetical protein [Micromonospora sp. ATCC 39149]EEP71015.1 hypothetical protein MCAG_01342 [Micromonospora sp. ATCC 39149]
MSRTMSKKHLLAGFAAAGVLGVGIAAPTIAFAEESATPPSAGNSTSEDTDRQQRRADRQQELAEALAKELGVPTDKVAAALKKVREQHRADLPEQGQRGERPDAADRQAALKKRLALAVKDGKLTQEQADAITKAVEAGVFPGGGGWVRHHHSEDGGIRHGHGGDGGIWHHHSEDGGIRHHHGGPVGP